MANELTAAQGCTSQRVGMDNTNDKTGNISSLEDTSELDTAQSRQKLYDKLKRELDMEKYRKDKLTVKDGMIVLLTHYSSTENCGVIDNFIGKLTSYDYRAQQISIPSKGEADLREESLSSSNWTQLVSGSRRKEKNGNSFSSRDIIYVILHCLDPFLRQDVLMKMSACQLAVPILLTDVAANKVILLLWGLRKISKAWCDIITSSIKEEVVVKFPFHSIAAFRIGNFPASKSNILNKVLGPVQGNDEHAFFTSFEQDSRRSTLSEGTLECAWFLPGNEKGPITTPFALLNLRGDSEKHSSLVKFATELSFVVILFINATLISKHQQYIEEMASHCNVVVIVHQNETTGGGSNTITDFKYPLTLVFKGGLPALDVGKEISKVIQKAFITSAPFKRQSLENATKIAKTLNIKVDEDDNGCSRARAEALKVKEEIEANTPQGYKLRYFHLQKLWKEWSSNDKKRSWTTSSDIEQAKAFQEFEQNKIRQEQASKSVSSHLQHMCSFLLNESATGRSYFLSWLQTCLNDISATYLKPLSMEITKNSFQRRNLSNQIHQLESDMSNDKTLSKNKEKVNKMKQTETDLKSEEENLIKEFDENILGIEHFIREFGQLVESYTYTSQHSYTDTTIFKRLPHIVARMLTEGYPLEILDGDASHVPITWLKFVFQELVKLIGTNATIYVISVLGIQSSGKSTLLNSMFGVRFATSAGRCTRGVFLQLLPVEASLARILKCDFIAIIDTEGLRAPEKYLSSYTEQDNELATFALCISDLTLINIGGQTMGEDMMNVLQIAAHAFVRMKQVNLNPECRIVQQFVADVTADHKNESAMQSIILKLDEAACEAAKREGKEHMYRQFSDIFTLQNYESDVKNIQYIPSLWRGFMATPDYQYSVRVQQLRTTILQSIANRQNAGLTSLEFWQRIKDVWKAILQEDFVFNFQNTKEVSLYQEVMLFYRNQIQPIRQKVLDMELAAKNAIVRVKSSDVDSSVRHWLSQISQELDSSCEEVSAILESKLKEKKYFLVKKYAFYFSADIKTLKLHTLSSIKTTLERHAEIIKSQHKKSFVRENMRKEIHDSFAIFAQQLKSNIEAELSSATNMSTDEIVEKEFQRKWQEMIDKVRQKHPETTLEFALKEIEIVMREQILQEVVRTDLNKDCAELLKKEISTFSSICTTLNDNDVTNLKSLFCDIPNETNKSFEELISKVKLLAEDHTNFKVNTMKALQLIHTEHVEKFRNSNWNVVLFYLCSVFVTIVHKSHLHEELEMILHDKKALTTVCTTHKIIPKEKIKGTLFEEFVKTFGASSEFKIDQKTLDELKTDSKDVDVDKIAKDILIVRILKYVVRQKESKEWLEDYIELLRDWLADWEDKKVKPGTEDFMKAFTKRVKTYLMKENLKSKRLVEAVKIAFKIGLRNFTESFSRSVEQHTVGSTYEVKYAAPHDFPFLKSKVIFMEQEINKFFQNEKSVVEFNEKNVLQFSSLPPSLSVLQKVDPCFIDMIPVIPRDKIYSVINAINEVKASIMSKAKPSIDFNAVSFSTHISEILDKVDKQVQAPSLLHTAAWALPIYAKCQYDYEREKSLTSLLEKEKLVLKAEFQSLSSNCQDGVIAERCFDIIANAITGGVIDKLYSVLYKSSTNDNTEFRTKKMFIGSVLKSLFESKNYHGIADLLSNFQAFSHSWILEFQAKQYSENPQFLENSLTSCFTDLIFSAKECIRKTTKAFKGQTFSDWIILLSSNFERDTHLSFNQNQIETIRKYLKVTDFGLLSDCLQQLLDDFKVNKEIYANLPASYDTVTVKKWMIDKLPKQLHVDLFDSFKCCTSQCPYCGTICDHNMTEHPKHESMSHFPTGINGWRNRHSKKLCVDICNSNVESTRKYKVPNAEDEYRPYKEYEVDFPGWKIRGQKEGEPTQFWKRLFVLFNSSLAERFSCEKGDVPPAWDSISDTEALQSLCQAYNLKI